MKSYSSTLIKTFSKNCPAALGHQEDNAPEYREIYQAGTAAHAVLQVVSEKGATEEKQIRAVADAVTEELITKGRAFKGTPEPPMEPEAAFEGQALAVQWLSWNELPKGKAEIWLAMDEKGAACPPGAHRYDAIIDLVYEEIEGDEDNPMPTVVARDYKSAWPTDATELETIQRKGQAVLVWKHYPDAQGITREVINLRTGGKFRETTWVDDEGIATLEQWENEILMLCRAADATREARPGIGCIGCSYVLHCEPCQALLTTKERPASMYAAAKAVVAATEPVLNAEASHGPVPDGVGGMIGYQATVGREVDLGELAGQVSALWTSGDIAGLVRALKPGVTAVDKLAKALYPGRDGKLERDDFCEAVFAEKRGSKFTTWRGK